MHFNKPKLPRVTLLVPCYQSSAYVDEAIGCALNQSYGHVETIVAPDDGKTYLELREKHSSPQLRIIAPGHISGTGAGAARNRALDASTGEFFAMLDADDLIGPNYIEDLMRVAVVEGAAIANTRYTAWDGHTVVRVPPLHKKTLSLSGLGQLAASVHPLVHRSLEVGYCGGFAEDVIHDGLILAKLQGISIVSTTEYTARIREGSLCNGDADDAEAKIQAAYHDRVDQILYRPTEIGAQVLSYHEREDFAELFRFRSFVSKLFSSSGGSCYNTWLAGKEASYWDEYNSSKRVQSARR